MRSQNFCCADAVVDNDHYVDVKYDGDVNDKKSAMTTMENFFKINFWLLKDGFFKSNDGQSIFFAKLRSTNDHFETSKI